MRKVIKKYEERDTEQKMKRKGEKEQEIRKNR
jgi:hypothetical protein